MDEPVRTSGRVTEAAHPGEIIITTDLMPTLSLMQDVSSHGEVPEAFKAHGGVFERIIICRAVFRPAVVDEMSLGQLVR